MAALTTTISIEEFHARYAGEPGFEYWFGEVVKKKVPTWLHGVLQYLLAELFFQHGYFSASDVDLRISREFQPRPDVVASLDPEPSPYPTKPLEIVAEILSSEDEKIDEKCQSYADLGISQIFVFDPAKRSAAEWNHEKKQLDTVETLVLHNGSVISVHEIYVLLDKRSARPSR
ncbi:MAG: Uma2 family endonuclease [Acidobacteriota bacterium]|nr:Uma2 family endonuclease [Acidobacteriota bacterium]